MKRIIYTVLFAVLISGLSFSCGGDDEPEESCDGNDLADEFCSQLDIDLIATFCSDGKSNSYYTYNGEKYTCTGVEASTCADALTAITAKMRTDQPDCFAKSTEENEAAAKIILSETAKNLLLNVRLNSAMGKGL